MRMTLLPLLGALLLAANAFARLPAPDDEAKVKAAEAEARAAWNSKIAAFKLCQAQNQAVADYQATMKKVGKTAALADAVPTPCVEPGPLATPARKP